MRDYYEDCYNYALKELGLFDPDLEKLKKYRRNRMQYKNKEGEYYKNPREAFNQLFEKYYLTSLALILQTGKGPMEVSNYVTNQGHMAWKTVILAAFTVNKADYTDFKHAASDVGLVYASSIYKTLGKYAHHLMLQDIINGELVDKSINPRCHLGHTLDIAAFGGELEIVSSPIWLKYRATWMWS